MGYLPFILLTVSVLIILSVLFFARGARTDKGTLGPHVTPDRPYADEVTPDRSTVGTSAQVENAKRETPPA